MTIIDIITVIPFYVEMIFNVQTGGYIRFLRLLRVLRLMRGLTPGSEASAGVMITLRAIQNSMSQIFVVLGYILIIMVMSSSFIYLAEQEKQDPNTFAWLRLEDGQYKLSPFQSIPHAFWWSITTLTTTGYGDNVPVTPFGKVIAGFTMLCGVLVIALPTSILGSNFVQEWQLHQRLQYVHRFRESRDRNLMIKLFHGRKAEQVRVLRQQNEHLLEAVTEIQDRLAELSPPQYYAKYKKMQRQLHTAEARIEELERELAVALQQAQRQSLPAGAPTGGIGLFRRKSDTTPTGQPAEADLGEASGVGRSKTLPSGSGRKDGQ